MNLPAIIDNPEVAEIVRRALKEDIGAGPAPEQARCRAGDITTNAIIPESAIAKAAIVSRGAYVLAGIDVARMVFSEVDSGIQCKTDINDGQGVKADQGVMTIEGPARGILTGERTALNFVQRMTGIATLTNQFVEKVKKYGVVILDTRKTTPGLRVLEKYAVLCGGGVNHRNGLYDRVLIKDNHLRIADCGLRIAERGEGNADCGLPIADCIKKAKDLNPGVIIEVEVENEKELEDALKGRPDWVLLDNMPPEQLRRCVDICAGRAKLEASGGITLENVEKIAQTGINAISLGCLTHSAPASDFSLEII
ncbi:nicotinate-nucleotide diphosphorylase [Verrucomicrobiota bacterium]